MSKSDGGPAYPCSEIVPGGLSQTRVIEHKGMSVRARFAESAMKGLLACPNTTYNITYAAITALKYADALIVELEKGD